MAGILARTGDRLRSLRTGQGLTREQLAARSEVSVRTIARIERGEVTSPHRSSLLALGWALEATLGERREAIAGRRDVVAAPWTAPAPGPSVAGAEHIRAEDGGA